MNFLTVPEPVYFLMAEHGFIYNAVRLDLAFLPHYAFFYVTSSLITVLSLIKNHSVAYPAVIPYYHFRIESAFPYPAHSRSKDTQWEIVKGRNSSIDAMASLNGSICVGSGCRIGKSTFNTKVIVGDNCRIGNGCRIERSIIWDNTVIGDNVAIKESIVGKKCEIQPNSVINEAVLGDATRVTRYSRLGHG